jgi:hypothetical protein
MKDQAKETERLDLDELLHPAQAFNHPSEVVNDPDLTINEKRAILASWASDACAVEAAHDLRVTPSGSAVRFDDILDALRTLDRQYNAFKLNTAKSARRRRIFSRGRGDDDQGRALQ